MTAFFFKEDSRTWKPHHFKASQGPVNNGPRHAVGLRILQCTDGGIDQGRGWGPDTDWRRNRNSRWMG